MHDPRALMSVKQLRNGRWQARWRDATGAQRSKNFTFKADAVAHEASVLTDIARGTYVAPVAGQLTVAEWADQWLAGARSLSKGTLETYRRDLDLHVLPVIGTMRLRSVRDDHIDALLTAQLEAKVAASTVHRTYRTIHRLFAYAVERRKLLVNPCTPVEPPKLEQAEMIFLTAEQVEALAGAISPRYRSWVLVAAYGGLRWSELAGLRRKVIDGPRVAVTEQLVRRADRSWDRTEPKTRAGRRVVTLPDTVAGELEEHLGRWSIHGADGLVFPNRGGRPLNGPSFRGSVFRPACRRARLDPIPRPHDLRHTAAALMVKAGAHPKAMQVRMGHSSIQVTLGTYGHLFPEMDAELAVRLDELRPRLRVVA